MGNKNDAERTEDMRPDKEAYEKSDVVDKVAATLAKFGGEVESPAPESEDDHDLETEEESTPDREVEEDDPADSDNSLSQDDDDDGKEEAVEDADEEADEKPAIPENVYRSLLHSEWTPEEISEFYEADPKKAMKVFEKVHKGVNDLSRQFAQIGRSRINLERRGQPQPVQQQQDDPLTTAIKSVKEDDPENPLIPVIEALVAKQRPQQEVVSQQQQQAVQQEMDMALASEVMTFFESDHMSDFEDVYGPARDAIGMPTFDGHGLTPGQFAQRQALVTMADEIWAGAQMSGRGLTVPEALERAHMILTEPIRERKVREKLTKAVKKRSKGMTLRPSKSKALKPVGGKPKTDEELEARAEARLRKFR